MGDGVVGHVVFRVFCRVAVLVGIDAEHREVAGVAGPHPVVGVGAELADRARRSAYEADVTVYLVDNQIIVVAAIYGRNGGGEERIVALGVGNHLHGRSFHQAVALSIVLGLAGSFFKLLCDVGHAFHEGNGKPGHRQLLAVVHCPIAVGEVVMLDGGKALDGAVAAVVVGQQQASGRDHLAGAAAAEMHHGILQGRMVDIVDVRGRELAAHLLHGLDVHLLEQREQPHALIG